MGKVKSPSKKETNTTQPIVQNTENASPQNPDLGFDVEQTLHRAEEFINKNSRLILYAGVGLLVVIGLTIGGRYYLNNQDKEAQSSIFQAQFYFEADSLNKALNGDGNNSGFLEIVDNYPFTKTSSLASYYAGLIYLKQEKFDEAIKYLKKYNNKDLVLQARAYCLVGDAYMEKGEIEKAASYYEKASNYEPNKQFTPEFLSKWAFALEKIGDKKGAIKCYDKIITLYPNSQKTNDAKRYKGILEADSDN